MERLRWVAAPTKCWSSLSLSSPISTPFPTFPTFHGGRLQLIKQNYLVSLVFVSTSKSSLTSTDKQSAFFDGTDPRFFPWMKNQITICRVSNTQDWRKTIVNFQKKKKTLSCVWKCFLKLFLKIIYKNCESIFYRTKFCLKI